jgi:hypothetical protein
MLCRDAFAFSHRSPSGRGVVDRRGKNYDACHGAYQRSQSWHGNRICRFENRRPAALSGISPGEVSLQLLNRSPKLMVKKSAQLGRGYLCSLIETAICSWAEVGCNPCVDHSLTSDCNNDYRQLSKHRVCDPERGIQSPKESALSTQCSLDKLQYILAPYSYSGAGGCTTPVTFLRSLPKAGINFRLSSVRLRDLA